MMGRRRRLVQRQSKVVVSKVVTKVVTKVVSKVVGVVHGPFGGFGGALRR